MDAVGAEEFPVDGLLPKKDTGVLDFLNKYPDYDGRGITIAILDSGVDPGAPGLQVTSDGRPKILHLYDPTGSGDCPTTTVRKAKDGLLEGLSGRKLKIPEDWAVPSGEFHVGLKHSADIMPGAVKDRLKRRHKETQWDPAHGLALGKAMKALDAFDQLNPSCNDDREKKLQRSELAARVDALKGLEKKYSYLHPVYDVVVYHDGNTWRACLDTSETGDLSSCVSLASYSEERQYATLGAEDRLNYSVNIYENGTLVEFVTAGSNHGTHVAGIAASFIPEEPQRSGVAPGAQLVSVKVGDTRMSSASQETTLSVVRAVTKCIELKVDLINMSYGEPTHWCNDGRMQLALAEAVKHGIVFLGSAGNNGPALSTVGAAAATTEGLISVGAYVTPAMMAAEYALSKKLPHTNYTWTSSGPSTDGGMGVHVSAPGGAITSVTNWSLRGIQLMNGTSMSSPNACGSTAVLVSALKAQGIPYNPYSVKRALENGASPVPGTHPLVLGHGSVNVQQSYDYMTKYHNHHGNDMAFPVTVGSICRPGVTMRGIYLRESHEVSRPSEHQVVVKPVFFDGGRMDVSKEDTDAQIAFNLRLGFTCDASWVKTPMFIQLLNSERGFNVVVDPTSLSPGLHFTEVLGFDLSTPERGPLVRVPVTVVVPEQAATDSSGWKLSRENVLLKPRDMCRHFIIVPEGATVATINLSLVSPAPCTGKLIVVHALPILPYSTSDSDELISFVSLKDSGTANRKVAVTGGTTLELCLAYFWSGTEQVAINYSLEFEGVLPASQSITMHANEGSVCVPVRSVLRDSLLAPSVTLKTLVQPLRPSDAQLSPLTMDRDRLARGKRAYSLLLTYNFSQTKGGEVTFDLGAFRGLLYESPLDCHIWMLFDSNKQYLTSGEAYKDRYTIKLEKGDYIVRLQLRHDKQSILDRFKEVHLLAVHTLGSSVSLDVHAHPREAALRGQRWPASGRVAVRGSTTNVYMSPLADDKVPKQGSSGMYLQGSVSFLKDGKDSFPIRYVLFEGVKKKKSSPKAKADKPTYGDALRDFNVSWIPRLDNMERANSLFNTLTQEFTQHVPLYLAKMNLLKETLMKPKAEDLAAGRKWWEISQEGGEVAGDEAEDGVNEPAVAAMLKAEDMLKEIEYLYREIDTKLIDRQAVLAYFGMKSEGREAADKSEMDKSNDQLVEGLLICGLAQTHVLRMQGNNLELDVAKRLTATVKRLQQHVDLSDSKCSDLATRYYMATGNYGLAYKVASQEQPRTADSDALLVKIAKECGWDHVARNTESAMAVRYPSDFRSL